MEIIIENKEIKVTIDSFGAELISIFDFQNGREYIWQKDVKYWGKSSPILFPFIGVIKNGKYNYNGKEYNFDLRHGFARDNEFEIVYKNDEEVEFLFKANEETKKIYPFNFKLYLKYSLKGKTLKMQYRVENLEDEKMYFSLGAHPAFSIPLDRGYFSDYFIEFEKEETGNILTLNGVLIDSRKTIKAFDGRKIILSKDTFKNDAIIIENPNSKKVYLKNNKNGYKIGFSFKNFHYIAFWNVPGAEFVCFEPWDGISDYDNTSGILNEKKGIECLAGKEIYTKYIKIEIL